MVLIGEANANCPKGKTQVAMELWPLQGSYTPIAIQYPPTIWQHYIQVAGPVNWVGIWWHGT